MDLLLFMVLTLRVFIYNLVDKNLCYPESTNPVINGLTPDFQEV